MTQAVLSWPTAIRCKANIACLHDSFLISLCQVHDKKIYKYILFGQYMQTHKLPYLPVVWNPKVISLCKKESMGGLY